MYRSTISGYQTESSATFAEEDGRLHAAQIIKIPPWPQDASGAPLEPTACSWNRKTSSGMSNAKDQRNRQSIGRLEICASDSLGGGPRTDSRWPLHHLQKWQQ